MGKANKTQHAGMHNEEGQLVEMYVPRKCSATNRLIPVCDHTTHPNTHTHTHTHTRPTQAMDHAAVQINIGEIDVHGLYTGKNTTYCLAGFIREKAGADAALNRLCLRDKILREN